MPKNYQKNHFKWCKKNLSEFFFQKFSRKKLSGKNFPEKNFPEKTFRKNFPEKLSGKNIPEKTFRKKLCGKTFRLNFLTFFFWKKNLESISKKLSEIFYIASQKKLFLKLSKKKLSRKTFHPKFQDKLALKLPWKNFLEQLSR